MRQGVGGKYLKETYFYFYESLFLTLDMFANFLLTL